MSSIDWKTLAQVIRIPPQAWDFFFPHGPVSQWRERFGPQPEPWGERFGPQPDPWRRGPSPDPWRDLDAALGASLVQDLWTSAIIIVSGRDHGSVGTQFLADIDDWCGTGWPHWRPKPKGPQPLDDRAVFLGGAVAAAVLADSFGHNPEAQEALGAAAERLSEQAQRVG